MSVTTEESRCHVDTDVNTRFALERWVSWGLYGWKVQYFYNCISCIFMFFPEMMLSSLKIYFVLCLFYPPPPFLYISPYCCSCCLVAQSCPTLWPPWTVAHQALLSARGIPPARILEWVAISFSRDLPAPGLETVSPALAGEFFTTAPPGKPQLSYLEPLNSGDWHCQSGVSVQPAHSSQLTCAQDHLLTLYADSLLPCVIFTWVSTNIVVDFFLKA